MDASILRGKHECVCSACTSNFLKPTLISCDSLGLWLVGVGFLDLNIIFAHVELVCCVVLVIITVGFFGWWCGCWEDVVCKFLRAHGGCLGIGSRRRTWESAISLVELITER